MSNADPQTVRPVLKREVFAWTLYDWANSSYSTLLITIVVVYLTTVVMPGDAGDLMYSYGIGVTMFIAALLSPVIGAIADSRANKSTWFRWTSLPGALAAGALGLVSPDNSWIFAGLFLISNVGYELSWGMYNAFLPEIADQKTMNRVSSYGFALGYIGGGLALLLAIGVIKFGDKVGLPTAGPLEMDYVMGRRIDFATQLPPGQYQVTLSMGDILRPHDQMDVSIQGEKVGTVSTQKGEFVERTFSIVVGEPIVGEVSTKLQAASIDPAKVLIVQVGVAAEEAVPAVLNGLTIVGTPLKAPLVIDFGTASSAAADHSYWLTEAVDRNEEIGDRWGPKEHAWLRRHYKLNKEETDAAVAVADASDASAIASLAGPLSDPLFLGLDPLGETSRIGSRDSVLIPRLQLCLVLMGAWWLVFSIPALVLLRDRTMPSVERKSFTNTTVDAFAQVGKTLRSVRNYRMLFLFLIAFLIYNDGVQTIITQASVFAQKVLHIGAGDLVMVVLMIQFVSMPGALLMGWLANKLGEKPTLLVCIGIYILWLLGAFFITTLTEFWIMGAVLALVMGGIQSVSRSIMGQMTPASRAGEFFGFFSLSGKATSFAGPIVFGSILVWTGRPHWAIISLLAFFLVGGGLASLINVQEGRRRAELEG